MNTDNINIPLTVKEEDGIDRFREPVSTGVPFPKGKCFDLFEICLTDKSKANIPFAVNVLDTWADGSFKWVLFDIQVSIASNSEEKFYININKSGAEETSSEMIKIQEATDQFILKNDKAEYHIDRNIFLPFSDVLVDDSRIIVGKGTESCLIDKDGKFLTPVIDRSYIESLNSMKAVLYFEGHFALKSETNGLKFQSRLFFYSGHSFVKVEFTIWNPNAAVHPDGFWDLGDSGSIFFKDLSFKIQLNTEKKISVKYKAEACASTGFQDAENSDLVIYQDSSGGENWNSRNHVNHTGKIPISFKGYKIYQSEKTIDSGLRATPVVQLKDESIGISGSMPDFWQNFPSAIGTIDNSLTISPFPKYFSDDFEIQAGEKKTHHFYFDFFPQKSPGESLDWTYCPLIVQTTPEWNCFSGAIPYLPSSDDISKPSPVKELFELTAKCVTGGNTFLQRREIIDEYGWRNFGDVFADHEDRLYEGEKPIISHYNNQYDLVAGFFFQYMRSGNKDWYQLFSELARHVMDIDIYHTQNDRYEYNHGMFWHTDHFASAGRGTHRGFTKEVLHGCKENTDNQDGATSSYGHMGGGPSYQHIYSHGLLNYYFMTGDIKAKQAAIGLANYVVSAINGPTEAKTIIKKMVKNCLAWAKQFNSKDDILPFGFDQGPGRGSGNALSTLLDGYKISKQKNYLTKAEYLIRSCIHPEDDITQRQLHNINMRWAYTIFLQSLGKYIDIKAEAGEYDGMFFYARESLLHYARWMAANEVFILSLSDSFDFPNFSTRAANDLRKANVLMVASKYAPEDDKERLREKALFFFNESAKALLSFDTSELTRPLAIIMQNINIPVFFMNNSCNEYIPMDRNKGFGQPKKHNTFKSMAVNNCKLFMKVFQ